MSFGGRRQVGRRYARGLRAIPAAVLAPVLGAAIALAAVTWTVRPGGAVSAKSGRFTLTDTTTGAVPACQASALTGATAGDGTVRFRYTNSTGAFRLGPTGGNLHFYNVRGCAGLFSTGDPVTVSASYTVAPRQTVTSP